MKENIGRELLKLYSKEHTEGLFDNRYGQGYNESKSSNNSVWWNAHPTFDPNGPNYTDATTSYQ